MKNRVFLTILALSVALCACDKENGGEVSVVTPDKEGVFVDERDNYEYKWVQIGDQQWMIENLRYNLDPDLELIDPARRNYAPYAERGRTEKEQIEEETKNLAEYGFLYDHAAALAAIPEGWRLPTDEDWSRLEAKLGSKPGLLMKQSKTGTKLGMQTGGYIGMLKGGYKKPNFIAVHGFFWTATTDTSNGLSTSAFYRKVTYNSDMAHRNSTLKAKYMSVRCVRDAQ